MIIIHTIILIHIIKIKQITKYQLKSILIIIIIILIVIVIVIVIINMRYKELLVKVHLVLYIMVNH